MIYDFTAVVIKWFKCIKVSKACKVYYDWGRLVKLRLVALCFRHWHYPRQNNCPKRALRETVTQPKVNVSVTRNTRTRDKVMHRAIASSSCVSSGEPHMTRVRVYSSSKTNLKEKLCHAIFAESSGQIGHVAPLSGNALFWRRTFDTWDIHVSEIIIEESACPDSLSPLTKGASRHCFCLRGILQNVNLCLKLWSSSESSISCTFL